MTVEEQVEKNRDPNQRQTEETVEAPGADADNAGEGSAKAEGEAKGLPLREALEKAAAKVKDAPESDNDSLIPRSKKRVIEKADLDVPQKKAKSKESEPEPLRPPGEWDKEGKEEFAKLPRAQQENVLKLYKSRTGSVEQIKREKAELNHLRALEERLTPFVKAMGVKEGTDSAMQKALQVWHMLESGDRQTAAAYFKQKGIEVPEDFLKTGNTEQNQQNSALLNRLSSVENKLTQAESQQVQAVLYQNWTQFEGTKNAAGLPKYPDVNETESGLKLAAEIGSLVNGNTPLSKDFIARAQQRAQSQNLQFTLPWLYEEAYKYLGGRIDNAAATKTQSTQDHLRQSNRAAASVPGRSNGSGATTARKFKDTREAYAAALEFLREQDGD